MPLRTTNPATGRPLREYPEHSVQDCESLLDRAAGAFARWRETSFEERSSLLTRAAGLLEERRSEYARIITEEMGKPRTAAEAEVSKCAWVCRHYAETAERALAPEEIPTETRKNYLRFDPLGPVLAIMPWNFPFWQVFRFAAPALMAGNVVLLKHASNVPACALAIEKLFQESGFPEGTFQSLLIRSAAAEALIADPRIAAVTLTGSTESGRSVAAAAGRYIKKTVLELGGSDPFIVLEDADLDAAVSTACSARIQNTGQSCIAAKRFLVHESIRHAFEQALLARFEALKVGDPTDPQTQVGPLARADLVDALDRQVRESVSRGARLLAGGKRLDRPGFFYAPTILTDVRPGMPAADEETFGPVAAILSIDGDETAVRLANATPFGLGASIWTRDLARAERLAARIEAGSVFINGMVKSDPRLPFGGIKASGYGRELGVIGLREFVNVKTVSIH